MVDYIRAPGNDAFLTWGHGAEGRHGVGLGDQLAEHQRMKPLGFDLGTRGWDTGWVQGASMVD